MLQRLQLIAHSLHLHPVSLLHDHHQPTSSPRNQHHNPQWTAEQRQLRRTWARVQTPPVRSTSPRDQATSRTSMEDLQQPSSKHRTKPKHRQFLADRATSITKMEDLQPSSKGRTKLKHHQVIIVREYVLHVFSKIKKNANFYVFLKWHVIQKFQVSEPWLRWLLITPRKSLLQR